MANHSQQHLPKISVVIPVLNGYPYLEECLDSILTQNYPATEIIVVDGGSDAPTLRIIKKYEKWLTWWISEPDRGQTDAINKGMTHATGTLANWLNADDRLLPGALHTIAEAHLHHPQAEVFCGLVRVERPDGTQETHRSVVPPPFPKVGIAWMQQPATWWRLDTIRQFLPLPVALNYWMDRDLWHRYLLSVPTARICWLEKELAVFRLHPQGKTLRTPVHSREIEAFTLIKGYLLASPHLYTPQGRALVAACEVLLPSHSSAITPTLPSTGRERLLEPASLCWMFFSYFLRLYPQVYGRRQFQALKTLQKAFSLRPCSFAQENYINKRSYRLALLCHSWWLYRLCRRVLSMQSQSTHPLPQRPGNSS